MRGPLPFLATLTLLSLGHLGAATRAAACSCAQRSPEEAARQAAAVFEGRVVAIDRVADTLVARLRVTRAWKGVRAEEVTVRTPTEPSLCGVALRPESYWLIYAEGDEGTLRTDLCQRTRPADDAAEDFAWLGAGVTPVDPLGDAPVDEEHEPNAPPARGGCASCNTTGGGPLASGAWLLLWGLRHRRRRRV